MWYDGFMKKFGLIQRKDIILFIVLLAACSVIFLGMFLLKKEGNQIIVEQNGKAVLELSLEDEGTYVIEDGDYYNKLVIKDGAAYVEDANGSISKVNETITCLPHKLIVYVVGDNISKIDAVVK